MSQNVLQQHGEMIFTLCSL